MKLVGDVKIEFGGRTLTQNTLAFDEDRMRDWISVPLSEEERIIGSDVEAFRMLLCRFVPLFLAAKEDKALVLGGFLKRFDPYIIGRKRILPFGISLVPKTGNIGQVALNQEEKWRVPINSLSITADKVMAHFGNGTLNIEIFFEPGWGRLPDLRPPTLMINEAPSKPMLALTE